MDEEKTYEVIDRLRHNERGLLYTKYSPEEKREMLAQYRAKQIELENTDFQN